MDQIRLEMDQKGLKLLFLYQKYLFLAEILFAELTHLEEIILNEASLGGSPTISCTLYRKNDFKTFSLDEVFEPSCITFKQSCFSFLVFN